MAALISRLPFVFAAATIGAQIAYPLCHGDARDLVTVLVVVLSAIACLTHAVAVFGIRWALGFFVATAGLGAVVEMIGTASGFPFGCYDYALDRIGPAIASVPLVIPLAWTAGVYPVWFVARLVHRNSVVRVCLTAIGVMGWDLYLDPQMVSAGLWTWCSHDRGLPGLPDIPYTNYVGWLAVALVMAALVERATRMRQILARDCAVPIVLFVWTWLGSALAHALFLHDPQLRYSACYGLIGMGVVGIPLLIRLERGRRASSRRHSDPCF